MTNVLVAGRDETLGVLDFGLNRFSVFEPSGVHYGFPDPGGGWVFTACGGHVVFVSRGGETGVIRAPIFGAELPLERDIADWRERNRARGRARMDEDSEALDEFRNTPKEYHLSWSDRPLPSSKEVRQTPSTCSVYCRLRARRGRTPTELATASSEIT